MKKFISVSLILITLFVLAIGVNAAENSGAIGNITDTNDVISVSDEVQIENYITLAKDEYGYSIVVVFTNSFSQNQETREKICEEYYTKNGYLDEGILLYVGVGSRTYNIYSCHKNGSSRISEKELDKIDEGVYNDLVRSDFSAAALTFAKLSYEAISGGRNENYFLGGMIISDFTDNLFPAFIAALVISLIILLIMKRNMKTVRPASGAATYLEQDSINVYAVKDRFLYSTVTKVRRDTDSSSGGGSGGGRSSSRSSGGSHRGGRF